MSFFIHLPVWHYWLLTNSLTKVWFNGRHTEPCDDVWRSCCVFVRNMHQLGLGWPFAWRCNRDPAQCPRCVWVLSHCVWQQSRSRRDRVPQLITVPIQAWLYLGRMIQHLYMLWVDGGVQHCQSSFIWIRLLRALGITSRELGGVRQRPSSNLVSTVEKIHLPHYWEEATVNMQHGTLFNSVGFSQIEALWLVTGLLNSVMDWVSLSRCLTSAAIHASGSLLL